MGLWVSNQTDTLESSQALDAFAAQPSGALDAEVPDRLAVPQVIHSTVVDTSVLFPHRLGLPYKRSLRNLMADYLRQIIQDNGEQWGGAGWRGVGGSSVGPQGWLILTCPQPPPHSGWAQLQRGCQRLHAPGDLEDSRRCQDQAVTAARPRPPSCSCLPLPLAHPLAPGLFQTVQ